MKKDRQRKDETVLAATQARIGLPSTMRGVGILYPTACAHHAGHASKETYQHDDEVYPDTMPLAPKHGILWHNVQISIWGNFVFCIDSIGVITID